MAINYANVQKAYEVFNELKKTVLPELNITSWPSDMADWTESEKKNPQLNTVFGFSKKSDSGWEELVFFVKNPSEELKSKFAELESEVGNSSISKPYRKNPKLWIFGWF